MPGPMLPAGEIAPAAPFPQSPLPLAVDLLMFGNWVEVTRLNSGQGGVYARDAVTVTRGRSSEGGTVDPTLLAFTLNNRDGRFSPRNPAGPYYGQIGRNTQARVRVGNDVRGVGEVTAWPQKWTSAGEDVWVPVQAAGILRRLQQGVAPLRSVLYRAVTAAGAATVAYWPCEDDTGATTLASAAGGPPLTVTGTPTLATSTVFGGSLPLPVVASSRWHAAVPAYASTGTTQIRFAWAVPAAGTTDGAVVARISTTGTAGRWDLNYNTAATGTVTLAAFDTGSANILTTAGITAVNGAVTRISIELVQNGSDIDWAWRVYTATGVTSKTGTLTGRTAGIVTTVDMDCHVNMANDVVGHISVGTAVASAATAGDEITGYAGETAAARVLRLCAEQGITATVVGTAADSAAMGAQSPGKLVDLLRECETADQGVLYEPRDSLGLAYRTRVSLYNQTARVTLDYAAADLSQIEPTDDDQLTRNDWTVTRTGGSSASAVDDVGPLSVLDPPDGVGRYDTAVTVNVETDAVLPDHAGWRLRQGTVDEPRYPQIGVNLARANFTAALTAAVAALDVGDRLDVANPPAWLPPGTIVQLAMGYTETLNAYVRTVVANCVPGSPWTVAVYNAAGSRYSTDGSTLGAEAVAGVTALTVATAAGPVWAHNDGDYDLTIAGERVTVTAVTGAATPQTLTVTRAVNGVSKTLPAGAAVALADPAVYAL
jgi:hypothetical protein